MVLHRDIYWVGRQWAVTGYGVQACDQKQKSKFDIEVGRLWDDDPLESLRAHKWLNVADLEKALSIARQRFPEPPRKKAPPPAASVAPQAPALAKPDPEPSKPAAPKFDMLFSGYAKFIRPWRVQTRK
jgi:hypothetical protein